MINKNKLKRLKSPIIRLLFAFCVALAATSKADSTTLPSASLALAATSEQANAAVDARLQVHTTAIVLDFENGTGKSVKKSVRRKIAAQFVGKLNEHQAFGTVLRESEAKKNRHNDRNSDVILAGVITRYRKKSANVRILVGVNEGISFFDTRIRIDSKKTLQNSLSKSHVDEITLVEDELINNVRDQGESVKEYVEDAAQYIARRYRSNVKKNAGLKTKQSDKVNS